jgi:Transposase IS66 family
MQHRGCFRRLGSDPQTASTPARDWRGPRDLIKVIWRDGQGIGLSPKRLERGRFLGRRRPMARQALAAGRSLFCLHLPLHRQSRTFARVGIEIGVSTTADWIGAVCVALRLMVEIIEVHVPAAQRLHVDDTPLPVLAKGKAGQGPRRAQHGGVGKWR